jgi:hypothetical protein
MPELYGTVTLLLASTLVCIGGGGWLVFRLVMVIFNFFWASLLTMATTTQFLKNKKSQCEFYNGFLVGEKKLKTCLTRHLLRKKNLTCRHI